jgi:hypothetical protein
MLSTSLITLAADLPQTSQGRGVVSSPCTAAASTKRSAMSISSCKSLIRSALSLFSALVRLACENARPPTAAGGRGSVGLLDFLYLLNHRCNAAIRGVVIRIVCNLKRF